MNWDAGDAGIEVEMSQKKLKWSNGDQLLRELTQTGDKVNVDLKDYITNNQSEGTLQGFFNKTTSGDHFFNYIENVDLPEEKVKVFDLKWNFETETFIQEIVEGSIPGITKPTYYFGSKYSAFPWHREDADLRSLSYLIAGAPKVCYTLNFPLTISTTSIFFRSGWGQLKVTKIKLTLSC